MANTSEQFVNVTLDVLSPLTAKECLKGKYFVFIFKMLTTALCFLVGTPAHLWCLWFYFCTEQKIKDTQVFFLNHTVMEIIYSINCGIEILVKFILTNNILRYVLYFFFALSWTGRPLLQICICIEQYFAVIHPVTFLRYKGIKYRIAAAVLAWLMAFAYGIYQVYEMIFPNFIFSLVFVIALAVILFCCVSVLCALKHPGPGNTHVTKQTLRDGGNRQKRNAFNTIFSALLLIVFAYLPLALLIVFARIGVGEVLFECNISPLMTSSNVLGVIITPLLKLYKQSHQKCVKDPK